MSGSASDSSVIRCDLHMHSRCSFDSVLSPARIVRTAQRKQLDVIAVTDHGTIRGGLDARDIAPDNLLVIVGAEIYTRVGDIVCLFLEREIVSRDALEVIAEAHEQGGIAFLPHPLRSHPAAIPPAVLAACDGFEALNSRAGPFQPSAASGTRSQWELLAAKAALGNSDAHFASEIGRAFTVMPGPPTTANVRRQILEARTSAAGATGTAMEFYRSQLIRLAKTRDLRIVVRALRGLGNRILRH